MNAFRRNASALVAALVVPAFLVSGAQAFTPSAAILRGQAKAAAGGDGNLLTNGGFEGSTAGWYGGNAALSLVAGGTQGSSAGRLALSGSGSSFWVSRSTRPASSTVKGTLFGASASFRSDVEGRRLCVRVREWDAADNLVGSSTGCVTSSRSWQQVQPFTYTAAGDGNQIDVYAFETGASPGDSFEIDDVELRSNTKAPAPKPPPLPPVPPTSPPVTAPTASTLDSAHVRLDWPAVGGASSYAVFRGTLPVGSTTGRTFTDNLLWPGTRYDYRVAALDAAGNTVASASAAGTSAGLPASGFPRIYSPASVWNQPLPADPSIDRASAAKVAYFVSQARNPNLTLHAYADPVAEAHPTDRLFSVPCTRYACTLQAFGAFPIPVTAVPDSADDAHLSVYDPATNREWDMWQAVNLGGGWSASAGAAVSTLGNGIAPAGTAGSNAANFPMLGGIVRPEEIAQGHIDHALYFTMPNTGMGAPVCPATHNGGSTTDPSAIHQGARLQLDPSLDVNSLQVPAHVKIVGRALQTYGMFLRDQGGSFAIYGENPSSRGYDAWANVGLGGLNSTTLRGLPLDRLRVIAAPDYPAC